MWVIIATLVIAFVAIVGIDWFIKRQKASTAATSETGASAAAAAPEAEMEVEAIEEGTSSRAAPRTPAEEKGAERKDSIEFMQMMMGDKE